MPAAASSADGRPSAPPHPIPLDGRRAALRATTINYLDRQVLGILAPTLSRELGWTESDYGRIVSWFSFAYGFGLLVTGRLFDWIGTRRGFSLSVIVWSLACMGHALADTVAGFSLARLSLGLGEAGNFPGAVKTVAEWFPKKERALAAGIFNAGTNVGVVLAPLVVPWITIEWGWRWAFIVTGAIGFIWLAFWLATYRDLDQHPKVSPDEVAYIRSDGDAAGAPIVWSRLLGCRQTWAFMVGKAFTDPVWFFYLFWLPKFLDAEFGVRLSALAAPLVRDLRDRRFRVCRWRLDVERAHQARLERQSRSKDGDAPRRCLLSCRRCSRRWPRACGSPSPIVSVAAAAHQWWSCNLFTIVSDMFPQRAVASVVGIGGFCGAMASMAFQRSTGALLEATGGNYTPIFWICGSAYVLALLVIHLLVPKMQPALLGEMRSGAPQSDAGVSSAPRSQNAILQGLDKTIGLVEGERHSNRA